MSIYRHGFARIAGAVPVVRIADPAANAQATIDLMRQASAEGAALVVFPEMGLTGYSIDDLVQQDAVIDAALQALATVVVASEGLRPLVAVGLPLVVDAGLYNLSLIHI